MKFADTYIGCNVVANLMGLNTETVRKRAKAGKIPAQQNARGTWVFTHNALVGAGIAPFVGQGLLYGTGPLVPQLTKVNVTDVFFVLDGSGSMASLLPQAKKNLDEQIETLKKSAGPNDQYNVTIVCFDSVVNVTLRGMSVQQLGAASGYYRYGGGMTRLNDAIAEAIRLADTYDDGRAFLISIVTDGHENASTISAQTLAANIRTATAKDRYTFVYAGPGGSEGVARSLGIPAGNITAWDQTVRGTETLGFVSNTSLGTYATSRNAGVMKSTSFYAQPVTVDPSKFANQLDDKLDDVSKNVSVERVVAGDPVVIKTFCEKKFGSFEKGKYFYQLTESEKVQDYKRIIIQDTATGSFYSGWKAAAKLLGIPSFSGTVRIKPGSLGEFKVFVQSTSVNRKLVPNTTVVYLP